MMEPPVSPPPPPREVAREEQETIVLMTSEDHTAPYLVSMTSEGNGFPPELHHQLC